MEWQHYNRIKASMAYIEGIVKDMEDSIAGKSAIYKRVDNDLTQEQLRKVKEEVRQIKKLLSKAKKDFNLEHDRFALSHIINVGSNFIWETVEDLWSHKLEKSSGKIKSKQKKENLDVILKQINSCAAKLKKILKNENNETEQKISA